MATSSFDEMLVIETPEQYERFMCAVKEAEERKAPLVPDSSESISERIRKDTEDYLRRWAGEL